MCAYKSAPNNDIIWTFSYLVLVMIIYRCDLSVQVYLWQFPYLLIHTFSVYVKIL